MKIRALTESEIDVRVASVKEHGLSLLLYKDARVDMNILDELGVKWQRQHSTINGKLFCTVSIYDNEIKEWVSRQDVGVESNAEATKGEASDSFKRACFNWGIGRELYTAPFIWIGADKANIKSFNSKYACYDKFSVEKIKVDDNKNIVGLAIKNDTTKERVFVWQA